MTKKKKLNFGSFLGKKMDVWKLKLFELFNKLF